MKIKINQDIKMPTKGRKALTCSKEELMDAFKNEIVTELKNSGIDEDDINDWMEQGVTCAFVEADDLHSKLFDDTSISFALENTSLGWNLSEEKTLEEATITLMIPGNHDPKEVPVILMNAGGDWEVPVYFIVYLDDKKKIRFYSPKPGNVFNPKNKEAFGNDEDKDEAFCKKIGMDYDDLFSMGKDEIVPDYNLMRKAIKARLIPC